MTRLTKVLARVLTAVALLATMLASPARAQQEAGVKRGFLTCHVASGWGFVFGSSRAVKCTFTNASGGTEYYNGRITKFGVDIGYVRSAVMTWAVVSTTSDIRKGDLAGSYGGATASASLGVGAGANLLVGGFNESIALQPLSVEGEAGLNVAAGVAGLRLDPAADTGTRRKAKEEAPPEEEEQQ